MMLEIDDIQHFLISRPPALAAKIRIPHLSPSRLRARVGQGTYRESRNRKNRRIPQSRHKMGHHRFSPGTVCARSASTKLRSAPSLKSSVRAWPPAQKSSVPRVPITRTNWVGGLASKELHAIVILFARDIAERERCRQEHREYLLQQCEGVKVLSSLDLEAIPPFTYAHEHFGYRDRPLATLHRRNGRRANSRLRPSHQSGRIFSRLSRRGRPARRPAGARSSLPQRQFTPPTFAWRSTSAPSATFCASTGTHPNSRSGSLPSSWDAGAAGAPLVLLTRQG